MYFGIIFTLFDEFSDQAASTCYTDMRIFHDHGHDMKASSEGNGVKRVCWSMTRMANSMPGQALPFQASLSIF